MAESLMANSDPTFVAVTTPAAGYAVGEVIQLPDGRAGALRGQTAKTTGQQAAFSVQAKVTLTKGTSLVILKGAPLYWDRSAGSVTPLKAVAGADFFIGVAVADAAAADIIVIVDLNVEPYYTVDIMRDLTDTVVSGDATVVRNAGYATLKIIATSEVEKCDIMSIHSVPVTIPFIVEGRAAVYEIGSGAAVDFNIGIANGTHATDAGAITESVFLHFDDALDIKAESDDGTTEVAATDTTVDAVDDTYFDFAFDCRDLTDIKIYINGVRVLSGSTFALGDATGPMKLLAHIEKTTGTTTGELRVAKLAIRATDLAA
ncbi:hypothetical protein LCGC14_1308640 [marine sediment metagenome]|uniref:Uncharacterized protein n=1 Tax=marine sediment metagenome TaxID=412755 RepID=A0A0F9KNH8_9ZZZZ|nr:hypothetical protein [Phycisphaerae bacterium]